MTDLDKLIEDILRSGVDKRGPALIGEKIAFAQVLAIREQTQVLKTINESLDRLRWLEGINR